MGQTWMPIFGNAEVKDGEISLIPRLHVPGGISQASPAEPEASTPPPHATVRSNIYFEQGAIEFEAKMLEPNARCYIGLSLTQGRELYIGLNNLGAPYGMAIWGDSGWEPAGGRGIGAMLEPGRWYRLKIDVKGSNIDFYVDEVNVMNASYPVERGPVSVFMQSSEQVFVRNVVVNSKAPECFVVMQFTEEYNALYREVIKPTCEAFGYKVVRADDTYTSGLIINDIIQSIQEATIVIADITPNNPNVFYEVGFSHGIGKTTILLSDKKREKLPFDVSGFRTLFYDNTIAGKCEVEDRLKKHLEHVRASSVAKQYPGTTKPGA